MSKKAFVPPKKGTGLLMGNLLTTNKSVTITFIYGLSARRRSTMRLADSGMLTAR